MNLDKSIEKGCGQLHRLAGISYQTVLLFLIVVLGVPAFGDQERSTRSSVPLEGICTNYDGSCFSPGAVVPDQRTFIPEPDHFPAMVTDDYQPSTSDLEAFVDDCAPYGFDIDIYNFFLDQVVTDGSNPAVQMICNFVLEHGDPPFTTLGQSCFNIFFPPNFDRQSAVPYPIMILANGWGMTNNDIFRAHPDSPIMVNRMSGVDNQGLVLVQWNCGGHGSLGLTKKMLKDVVALIDILSTDFHCDRHRIAIRGGSRAGGIALELARNRYDFDYTVVGIFVRNPAISLGLHATTPVASCPALASVYCCLLGEHADRYSQINPPMVDPAPILFPILETADPPTADFLSPDGGSLASFTGKFILLSTGAHDVFFRLDAFIGLTRRLSFAGIPHSVIIKLQSGHGPGKASEFDTVVDDFLEKMIMDGIRFDPTEFHPGILNMGLGEDAMNYFCRTTLDNFTDSSVYRIEQDGLPFIATFPHRLGRDVGSPGVIHEPGAVFLCGAPGQQWHVQLLQDEGAAAELVQEWSGQFEVPSPGNPYAETAVIQWSYEGLPGMDMATCYSWKFYYNGIDVSDFTNLWIDDSPIPARTEITPWQPWGEDYRLVPGCGFSPGIDYPGPTIFEIGSQAHPVTLRSWVDSE